MERNAGCQLSSCSTSHPARPLTDVVAVYLNGSVRRECIVSASCDSLQARMRYPVQSRARCCQKPTTAEGCTGHGECDAPADLGACLMMALARIAAVVAIL